MELTRRDWIKGSAGILGYASLVLAQSRDPLPSWNDGAAKQAIFGDLSTSLPQQEQSQFVPTEDRIATFDQDGTTWVEHPIYSQVLFAYDRVVAIAPQHPEWKTTQPFQAVLTRDKKAMEQFTLKDLEAIVMATHTGMTVEVFQKIVKDWMARAKHPHFNKPYPKMVYQPMLDVNGVIRARQRLQDLHCDGRRARLRARVRRGCIRRSAGTHYRLGTRNPVHV